MWTKGRGALTSVTNCLEGWGECFSEGVLFQLETFVSQKNFYGRMDIVVAYG